VVDRAGGAGGGVGMRRLPLHDLATAADRHPVLGGVVVDDAVAVVVEVVAQLGRRGAAGLW
jgi:hypothetical protein